MVTWRVPLVTVPAYFTFAHLALCAAAIRFLPAAEIVRFGLAVLVFAHRAFCARLILRRPAADIVRDAPFELLPSAASACVYPLELLLCVLTFLLQLLDYC